MPQFDGLEPLAHDACRSDRSAPCSYWHAKVAALNGGRAKMSAQDLEFVGVAMERAPHRPAAERGWHQIGDLPALAAVDENDVEGSATDAAIARASRSLGMSPGRLEFLG